MKKKINILLIVVVLGLWGTAIYRYLRGFFLSSEVSKNATEREFTDINDFLIKRDTFILRPVEHDPFFDRMITAQESVKPLRPYKPVTYSKKEQIVWPVIEYFGYIKPQSNKELILLKINNKLFRLRIFEQKDGVKVNKIYKDSVQLIFNNEKKIIKHNS